ncbi:hypothetical protein N836_00175 [Leptolyngbya sp. Heron Island J]|uniref:hypothetical protein n=1 Tax=Leptolyngbya sp. Heron Island J TaxID=1385935 RepID=UPI0003B9EF96|nr:hypothetical protein [Leptolyngbya sp. Heron Island J]ESA37130.1 hypothetical protein N836_00175 [Leptolyngbya sp. Heron Island J]
MNSNNVIDQLCPNLKATLMLAVEAQHGPIVQSYVTRQLDARMDDWSGFQPHPSKPNHVIAVLPISVGQPNCEIEEEISPRLAFQVRQVMLMSSLDEEQKRQFDIYQTLTCDGKGNTKQLWEQSRELWYLLMAEDEKLSRVERLKLELWRELLRLEIDPVELKQVPPLRLMDGKVSFPDCA